MNMIAAIIALAVVIGAINMGFEQGQANPKANNFFASDSQSPSTK